MIDANSPLPARMAKFVQEVMSQTWEGSDCDGGFLQDLGLRLGLIKDVPYDPATHGNHAAEEYGCQPGDPLCVLTDDVKAALAAKEG